MEPHLKLYIYLLTFAYSNYPVVSSMPRLQASSTSPPSLSLYKYEGNVSPISASKKSAPNQLTGLPGYSQGIQYLIPVQINQQTYHVEPVESQLSYGTTSDENEYGQPTDARLLHRVESGVSRGENPKIHSMSPEQRNPVNNLNGVVPRKTKSVARHYHDIFLKMKSPQELVFGHVLNWPDKSEKKLEKRGRNHYTGQVIWADKKGGYGEHYWDLAQGTI